MQIKRERQNYAVMNQRHSGKTGHDDFPTPPWATRALCEHPWFAHSIANSHVWEPAAGRGYMAHALRGHLKKGKDVVGSDIYSFKNVFGENENVVCDFLSNETVGNPAYWWVITNPPFRLAADFARRSLTEGFSTALFVRLNWLESEERYELFREFPVDAILLFSSRVGLMGGMCSPLVSTATAYCWVVWTGAAMKVPRDDGFVFCRSMNWLSPNVRAKYERSDDYPGFVVTGRSEKTGRLIWKPDEA